MTKNRNLNLILKNFKIFALIFIVNISTTLAQTPISGGAVSGTWTLAGSPYLIQGNIVVSNNTTLTIDPGVEVNFQGSYKLLILGRILAIGNPSNKITITDANTTTGWKGIRFDGITSNNDTSKFIHCIVKNGKASGSGNDAVGGAFFFDNTKAIIANCVISNSSANSGGAIYSYSSSPIIKNNIITDNTSGNQAGGIMCASGAPLIQNNIIINNSSGYGGALYVTYNTATISGNIISNNTASFGGGIYMEDHYSGLAALVFNNIISNNTATSGGAIYCDQDNSIYINNTIVNNKATNGGAFYCDFFINPSSPTFTNSIIWGNTAVSGSQVFLEDESCDPNFYNCDLQSGSVGFFVNGNIYTGIYQNNIDQDPLFATPAGGSGTAYNGQSADWSLQNSSPGIDAGAPGISGILVDQIGNPRIVNGMVDIGALEFQGAAAKRLSISPTQISVLSSADNSKTFSITSNTNWIITVDQPWLLVNTFNGFGNGTLALAIESNPTSTIRTSIITVSGNSVPSKILTVLQDGFNSNLSVSTSSITLGAVVNRSKTFTITSNVSWVVLNDQPWLTLSPGTGSGNNTITVTADENLSAIDIRSSLLTVMGLGIRRTVSVFQAYNTSSSCTGLATLPISGPQIVTDCNPVEFSVASIDGLSYKWSSSSLNIVDPSNSTIKLTWNIPGVYPLSMKVFDNCSTLTSMLNVTVTFDNLMPVIGRNNNNLLVSNRIIGAKYQWQFDGANELAETQYLHINSLKTGTYTACISSIAGCSVICSNPKNVIQFEDPVTVTCMQIQCVTALEKELHSTIEIYPNPTNGILNFLTEKPSVSNVEVYNAFGECIYKKPNSNILDLTNDPDGIYMVKCYSGEDVPIKVFKVIKSNASQ